MVAIATKQKKLYVLLLKKTNRMDNMSDRNKEEAKVVNKDDVELESFKLYDSSNDDFTKVVDGELQVQDFNMYKEE